MGTMLAIGGVIGLILWLSGAGSPVPPKNDEDKKKVVPPPPAPGTEGCSNCMCPDATIDLKTAQKVLINLGMLPAKTASGNPGADGHCGPMTTNAIRNYQYSRALAVTGFINKETSDGLLGESVPASGPTTAEKDAAKDYADGCNAGSKDASLSVANGSEVIHANYNESASTAWHQGYRDCLASSLTGSGYTTDEDGNLFYSDDSAEGTSTWIGDTLGSPDAGVAGVARTRSVSRANTIRSRAAHRRSMI